MNEQNAENFRQSMRRLASTVSIISCEHEGTRYGITVTSVTSLCMAPQSILACINQSASIWSPLLGTKRYCVNLLSDAHVEISKRFSGAVPAAERFLAGDWRQSEDGIPYLAGAQANIFCELDHSFTYATHDILIGKVTSSLFSAEVSPLIYQNGTYAVGAPLQAAA